MKANKLIPLLRRGDGSTLSLDFTAMSSLDSRFTFTRASTTSTFINSSGLVATAGTNVARFDYDPTTLAPRGLLIEGSATNLLLSSESFSTNWVYNSNTGAVVSTSNPQGGSTAFQFAETANSGPLQQSVTVTNAVHTFSAWFKGSTYSGTTTTQVQFGLFVAAFVAGTATKISGPGSVSVASNIVTLSGLSTSEWTRVQFTTTAALPAGTASILIYPNSTGAESNASFYIWGAQLEAGSGASSYIPTGSSTVQRAADSCSMTGTNFSSWYPAGTTSGTFFCQFDNSRSNLGFAINPTPIALGEYSAGNLIAGLMNTTVVGSGATISVWGSGGSGLQQSAIGATISQGNKIAFAFNGQTATGSLNGGSGTATTTGTVNAKTILFIGGSGSGSSLVRDYIVAPIQRIKFFPSVFSTAQLQSLTQ